MGQLAGGGSDGLGQLELEKVNFPTKVVNLLFNITNQNNKLTMFWGT